MSESRTRNEAEPFQLLTSNVGLQGGQTKQGELFIALTHEDHKASFLIEFSKVATQSC